MEIQGSQSIEAFERKEEAYQYGKIFNGQQLQGELNFYVNFKIKIMLNIN